MKRTLIAILTLTLAAAAFAAPGGRGPQGHRGPGGGGRLSPKMVAEFLELSEAQKTQAEALRTQMRATIEPLRGELRANREATRAAVDAGNAQQAGQLLIAGKAIRERMKAAHETFAAKFEALLTAEQKAKWAVVKELQELRRDQRRQRRAS